MRRFVVVRCTSRKELGVVINVNVNAIRTPADISEKERNVFMKKRKKMCLKKAKGSLEAKPSRAQQEKSREEGATPRERYWS